MINGVSRQLAVIALLLAHGIATAATFHFVALGDTAYNDEADYPIYAALIESINATQPAFTIHVGDIWGGSECLDADHQHIAEWFARYDHPLIYTPGDNEWTDCIDPAVMRAYWRLGEGKGQPGDEAVMAQFRAPGARANRSYEWALASLQRLRRLHFSQSHSLGQRTRPLLRQAKLQKQHRQMLENTRWQEQSVLFATLHVVGSANGLAIGSDAATAEAIARNRANVDWLISTFEEAARSKAKAVVLAMHGAMFDAVPDPRKSTGKQVRGGRRGPYYNVVSTISELGTAFAKPVLLIHGDDHEFIIDRPFMVSHGESKAPTGANITRLQVFGAPELRAVRINVDPATVGVFSFQPLYKQ